MSAAEKTTGIEINHVDMIYHIDRGSDVTALTDISLNIEQGTFVSLLGPSGCGKTTLLRIVGDFISCTGGTIAVDGLTPHEARRQRKFGMVFQNAVMYDWRTVKKNVMLPLEIMNIPKKEREERAEDMLELVGLSKFADNYPYELSGGMQQRTSIARALAINPEIMLMDEPFSALDEFTREKLQDDLLSIWRKRNMTIIFVTHNISESVYLSDQVVVMSPHPGRVSKVVNINLPRPRSSEMRDTPEYYEYIAKIRSSFEGV